MDGTEYMSEVEQAIERVLQGPRGKSVGAFFDFDGTLIDGFSAGAYFIDRIQRRDFGFRQVVDTLKMARKKEISDAEFLALIKDGVVEWAGQPEQEMRNLWKRLWLEKVGATLFPEGWRIIQAHKQMGHTIAIASSATRYQIEPLAEEYGIDHVLATPVKVRNGRLTGGLDGSPLWGQGKADAVKAFCKRNKISLAKSYGYANGDEDIAFLKSVGKPTAVQPKPKLLAVANQDGWPVLRYPPRKRGPAKAMARTVGAYSAMGMTALAGLGYMRMTGDVRGALDKVTAYSSDAAFAVLGVKLDVIGRENLDKARPAVILLNHQSKFDMFVMMNLVRKNFTGVAKAEARKVPGFGKYMEMAEVAFINRSNSKQAVEALKPAVDRLKKGLSVCIAPEGTRSWTPKLGKFKKGPFHLAMQAGVPLIPVVIRNAGEIMGRNDQTMRSGTIQVCVLDPIPTDDWTLDNMEQRIEQVRNLYIKTLEKWPSEKTSSKRPNKRRVT